MHNLAREAAALLADSWRNDTSRSPREMIRRDGHRAAARTRRFDRRRKRSGCVAGAPAEDRIEVPAARMARTPLDARRRRRSTTIDADIERLAEAVARRTVVLGRGFSMMTACRRPPNCIRTCDTRSAILQGLSRQLLARARRAARLSRRLRQGADRRRLSAPALIPEDIGGSGLGVERSVGHPRGNQPQRR